MADLNNFVFTGRMVEAAELRYTPGDGIPVATFSIACNGIKDNDVDFFKCVAWRNNAERIADKGEKGKRFAFVGELHIKEFDGKDGKKVKYPEITVSSFRYL